MLLPQGQGQHLANMISQATNAWGDELDSRVAQNREYRRMLHEQQLRAMAMEEERMRQQVALEKIDAEQQMMRMKFLADDARRRGDESKTLVNGRWVPSWMA